MKDRNSYNYLKLWEPLKINKLTIRNRIALSPMGPYTYNQDGTDSEDGIRYFEERARGGVGLLHTGSAYVSHELSQGSPSLHPFNIKAIPRVTTMVERAHRWGAKFFLQLSAGTGRCGKLDLNGGAPICSSAVPAHFDKSVLCRPMTKEQIKQTVEDFKAAALWATRCGFDGIQIHAHAGYLLDTFFSEVWNKREDEYGGSMENRCRFAVEIIEGMREIVGPDYPITFRISLDHRFEGGRTQEDSMEIIEILDRAGIDAFDLDAGCYETEDFVFPTRYVGEACMDYVCEMARKHTNKPIISTGNHSMETAVDLLDAGHADIIQFGRQLIADPQFPNKLKAGKREHVRPCIICNEECIGRIFARRSQISCTVNPSVGMENHMRIEKLEKAQNVVVIGAGPGGMEAARCAALRGCHVTLVEKGDTLGGTFKIIATGDFKVRMRELCDWYELQLKDLGVKTILNYEIGAEDKLLESADAIFVATGSLPFMPPISGAEGNAKLIDVQECHDVGLPEGKKVVICGGGLSACDTALEYMHEEEREITIVEMREKLGADVFYINSISILRQLNEGGVRQLVNTRVEGFTDEGVLVTMENGEKELLEADVIVTAFGRSKNLALADAIMEKYAIKTKIIGDCHKPSKAGDAIRDGFYAALSLQDELFI